MDYCITAESKQKVTLRTANVHVDLFFDNDSNEKTFLSVLNSKGNRRGYLVISEVKVDGYFRGEIKL